MLMKAREPRTVFLFSGQGSHYYEMGRTYYEAEPRFRQEMQRLDAIVRDLCGCSIVETLYHSGHKKGDTFDRTLLTSAAIFMVEHALATTLIAAGTVPDLVLGTSMGSFAAAAIAGCIDAAEALTFVVRQSKVLESSCAPGAMIAVLDGARLHEEAPLAENSEVASFNCRSHFVVACRHERMEIVESFLRHRHVAARRLGVSLAFHSRWIQEAEQPFAQCMRSLRLRPARTPVACCAATRVYSELPQDFFWKVVRQPIRFQQTVAHLEESESYRYIDVGPSGTLATFLKYCLPPESTSTTQVTMRPFGNEIRNLQAVTVCAS
jgi:acyl transferase domain-containing protein